MATNVSLTTDNPSWTWTEAEADTEYNFQLGVSGAEVNFTGAGSVLANFDGSNPFTIYAEDTNLEIGNLNGGAGDQPITIEVGPNSVIGFDQFQPQWLDNIDLSDSQLAGLHAPRDLNGVAMRWTDGRAIIPQALHQAQGRGVLELHVVRTYAYWETSQAQQLAA